MPGDAAQDEQIREQIDDVDRLEPARYPNGQALVGERVDDVEQAELASIMGAFLDKVVGPDVVGALGSQPGTRSVSQPQAGTLGMSGILCKRSRLSLI